MTALKELLEQTGCAEELATLPRSWEDLMTAVAAGAIDYDAVAEVATECAALAYASCPNHPWDEVVNEALMASDGDVTSEPSLALIACGKAADRAVREAN